MYFGFIFFACQAMMAYKTVMAARDVKKFVHMLFHLIAICLGIVGLHAVFKYHDRQNIKNMYSLHSWIGIATFSLYVLQVHIYIPTTIHLSLPFLLVSSNLTWMGFWLACSGWLGLSCFCSRMLAKRQEVGWHRGTPQAAGRYCTWRSARRRLGSCRRLLFLNCSTVVN